MRLPAFIFYHKAVCFWTHFSWDRPSLPQRRVSLFYNPHPIEPGTFYDTEQDSALLHHRIFYMVHIRFANEGHESD